MLKLVDIHKQYEGRPLLAGISFSVAMGETVCLLGASGSGKSTLLRIIAGLERADNGQIFWDGQDLTSIPVHQRNFGLVFQDYALFPHLKVAGNVGFGLRIRSLPEEEIVFRVGAALERVNMKGFENRDIASLSGGEQQRVALARALAIQPRMLMMDEPLGALDRALKDDLLAELRKILHESGIPTIYVTHDQEEASTITDRVLILHDGQIAQSGSPADVCGSPSSAWVASFLGLGNLLMGRIKGGEKTGWVVETNIGDFLVVCKHEHMLGDKVNLLIKKNGLRLEENGNFPGKVVDIIFQQTGYAVTLDNGLTFTNDNALILGETIYLEIPDSALICLP